MSLSTLLPVISGSWLDRFAADDSKLQTNPVEIETFDVLLDRQLIYERLLSAISLAYGIAGMVLTAVGAYAVAAYAASKRTFEVGIRLAVGATRLQLVCLFAREQLLAGCLGLGIGIWGAWWLTGFLKSWLFGVTPRDLSSISVCAALLLSVMVMAILIPLSRAVRTDIWQALRSN